VTIETITPYPAVKQRMQAEVKRLDDSYRQLLSHNELVAVRKKLEEDAQPNASMLHYVGTHSGWLDLKRRAEKRDPAGRRLIHRKICRLETAKCPIIDLPQLSALPAGKMSPALL
jgi:hypothetical protein